MQRMHQAILTITMTLALAGILVPNAAQTDDSQPKPDARKKAAAAKNAKPSEQSAKQNKKNREPKKKDKPNEKTQGDGTPKISAEQGVAVLGVIIGTPYETAEGEAPQVVAVRPNSAAAEAGIQKGDRIQKMAGEELTSAEDLRAVVLGHKPGDKVKVDIRRGDDRRQVEIVLGRRGGPRQQRAAIGKSGWLGIAMRRAAPGVGVARVLPESPAAKAGIQPGDKIARVNETRVAAPADLAVAIKKYAPGEKVTLVVVRDGERKKREVTLGESARGEQLEMGEDELRNMMRWLMPRIREMPRPRPGGMPRDQGDMNVPTCPGCSPLQKKVEKLESEVKELRKTLDSLMEDNSK